MNTPHPRPKIAVIGAGWAGLSAAVTLARHADVTLFEAGRQAGGRARTLAGNTDGFGFLDNGQHILLGAYRGVLRLMKTIGSDPRAAFLRVPLHWHMHGGLQFRALPLPAPLHILGGVLLARRVPSAFKAKLLADMSDLQKSARLGQPDTTVAQWLKQRNVPRAAVMQFWQPLVWGALNTPLETASLRVLCNVLSDGVLTKKSGSDYLLPKQDLGAIVAEPALAELQRLGADIRLETRVCRLNTLPDGKVLVNGEAFDAAILATAPYHAAALLPEGTPEHVQTAYQNLRYHAITTVYLRYAEPVRLPAPLTGIADGTAQWLLCRAGSDCPKTKSPPSLAFPTASARLQTGRGRTKPTPTSDASFRIWANPKPCASSPKNAPQPQPMPRRRICRGCTGTVSSPPATTSTRTTPPRSKPPYNQVSRRRKPACKA